MIVSNIVYIYFWDEKNKKTIDLLSNHYGSDMQLMPHYYWASKLNWLDAVGECQGRIWRNKLGYKKTRCKK